MSNYMILPELDSNSVKIGLTKCGVSTAPHSLYKRYHTAYGGGMTIFFWPNTNYVENEKIILDHYKEQLCEKTEILMLNTVNPVKIADIITFCERTTGADTFVYSKHAVNLNKNYGEHIKSIHEKKYRKELYKTVELDVRMRREKAIQKAIQKEFDQKWSDHLKQKELMENARKIKELEKIAAENAALNKKLEENKKKEDMLTAC